MGNKLRCLTPVVPRSNPWHVTHLSLYQLFFLWLWWRISVGGGDGSIEGRGRGEEEIGRYIKEPTLAHEEETRSAQVKTKNRKKSGHNSHPPPATCDFCHFWLLLLHFVLCACFVFHWLLLMSSSPQGRPSLMSCTCDVRHALLKRVHRYFSRLVRLFILAVEVNRSFAERPEQLWCFWGDTDVDTYDFYFVGACTINSTLQRDYRISLDPGTFVIFSYVNPPFCDMNMKTNSL